MKTAVLGIWVCLLFILASLSLIAPPAVAQSPLEQATFCTSGSTRGCPDIGICTNRTKTCVDGRWSEQCTGGTPPAPQEICDNALDDNCNGVVDECVSLSGSIGIFMIIGGIVMLVFALALSRVMK